MRVEEQQRPPCSLPTALLETSIVVQAFQWELSPTLKVIWYIQMTRLVLYTLG